MAIVCRARDQGTRTSALKKVAPPLYDDATLNFEPTVRQDETLLLLSNFSAELHRLVRNFFTACAESNGRDDSCENDEFFHLLLSFTG